MRVGVFGGTFDPPHVGHLLTAVDAAEQLGLDRLLFVPAGAQPLKVGSVTAAPEQRLAMTRLLAGDDGRFAVDPIEIERAGLSYSVDTLEALAARWPEARLHFLVGADVVRTFAEWREPERVAELAQLVVLDRAGDAAGAPGVGKVAAVAGARRLATRRVDVSSTEVRARVRAGQSIRGFVPEAIADFIGSAGLYR
jgi:nicotinate-nucleotide adenylyltransferase